MTQTDESLIADTVHGDLEAYDELMQRYQRLVYKVAYRYADSHEGALDLTQTIFLKVFRKLSSFRGRSQFKTWLLRVAANEGVSWVRANRRHIIGRESLRAISSWSSSDLDPEDRLALGERRQRLLDGLTQLGQRYRTALVLRYFHGFSIREVASVLGCSEGTAKNLLFRGVRRLREQLARG
jgi:RNA polymerase sigma-70 factor (ECF subfamily)